MGPMRLEMEDFSPPKDTFALRLGLLVPVPCTFAFAAMASFFCGGREGTEACFPCVLVTLPCVCVCAPLWVTFFCTVHFLDRNRSHADLLKRKRQLEDEMESSRQQLIEEHQSVGLLSVENEEFPLFPMTLQ